jgi:hypothetical protein
MECRNPEGTFTHELDDEGQWRVCGIHGPKAIDTIVETDAGFYAPKYYDALLIASAPELLRTVEKAYIRLLTERSIDRHSENHQRDLCEARDVLAKALGETEEAVQTHYEAIVAEADRIIKAREVTK